MRRFVFILLIGSLINFFVASTKFFNEKNARPRSKTNIKVQTIVSSRKKQIIIADKNPSTPPVGKDNHQQPGKRNVPVIAPAAIKKAKNKIPVMSIFSSMCSSFSLSCFI